MCSYFLQRMENYQGDLTDIVRASGGPVSGGDSGLPVEVPVVDWQFPADPINYQPEDFGDPFSSIRDPLLHELHIPSSGFFNSSNNSTEMIGGDGGDGGCSSIVSRRNNIILDGEMELKRPCNIFSSMLQISPTTKMAHIGSQQGNSSMAISPCGSPVVGASPRAIKASPLVPNEMISVNTSKSCLIENSGVQISSPRNTGIKRRKSQAKKVVCIPAPAPANSRPSGEVVPSDLWAWRKYGQKPIKGSPYPRGYYRCSSSKGCSARKQVERSRTDPNMLVITYTSEHNHPWPTQRNALAGSTRSQLSSKTNSSAAPNESRDKRSTAATKSSFKDEQKDSAGDYLSPSSSSANMGASSASDPPVKEELLDKEMEDGGQLSEGFVNDETYRPALMPDPSNQSEDFFAGLGEIEADPLNLLFTHGFSGDDVERENNNSNNNKALDPFTSLFDWALNNNNNSSNNNDNTRGL